MNTFSGHQRSPSGLRGSGSGGDSSKVCCHSGFQQETWGSPRDRTGEVESQGGLSTHTPKRGRQAAEGHTTEGEFEKKWRAVSNRALGGSWRADGTVGKEGIKLLPKKLNRKVFKITAKNRYGRKISKKGKNCQWGKERGELNTTRQTDEEKQEWHGYLRKYGKSPEDAAGTLGEKNQNKK